MPAGLYHACLYTYDVYRFLFPTAAGTMVAILTMSPSPFQKLYVLWPS